MRVPATFGSAMPYPGFLVGFIYVLMGLLYFFPIYYLFRFSAQVRPALASKNPQDLESALENLKSHYKFIGILMIVMISIYVLIGGGALIATAFI